MQGALAELSAPEDADVKIEVLESPMKKKFGLFGGSPAKVRAYYEVGPVASESDSFATDTSVKPAAKVQNAAPATPAAKPAETPAAKADEKPGINASSVPTAIEEDLQFFSAATPLQQSVEAYLKTMLWALGLEEAQILFSDANNCLFIQVDCGSADYGTAIGRRGDTLDSLQYLTRLFINRSENNYERVTLNVGDYRKKRESTLRSLAQRSAERVKKYGRNVVLDPMNPFDRRIVHTTVQGIEGVSSHSVGSDDERKVIITLEGAENRGFQRGRSSSGSGYNNRGRDSRDFGNRSASRPPRQSTSAASSRPPRSDDSSLPSKYGKIEVHKDNQ